MSALAKRILLPVGLISLLAGVAVAASHFTSLDWLVEHDGWLRQQIQEHPVSSFFIGFTVYLLTSLIPGTPGKSIVLGWLYGLLAGVAIVNLAMVLAAVVTFLICRHSLRAAIQDRFGRLLQPVEKRMQQDGAFCLLMLRLAHAPFSLVNYASGAGTDVPLRTFWWTTQLGLLPGNIVVVFAGTRLPTLEELVRAGPAGVLDAPLIAALAGTVAVPWLTRKIYQMTISRRKSV